MAFLDDLRQHLIGAEHAVGIGNAPGTHGSVYQNLHAAVTSPVAQTLAPLAGPLANPGFQNHVVRPLVNRAAQNSQQTITGVDSFLHPERYTPAQTQAARASLVTTVGGLTGSVERAPLPAAAESLAPSLRTKLAATPPVKIAQEAQSLVNPGATSSAAQSAADLVRGAKATITNARNIELDKAQPIVQHFDRLTPEANISNISQYERTGQFSDAPKGYSDLYKQSTDAAHATLKQVYGQDRVGYIDNYVRHAFTFATPQDEAAGTQALYDLTKSLSASKAPIKGRLLDVPLDEALSTMQSRGINVAPVTTNPELLRQWTVSNANQAKSYAGVWDNLKSQKLIQFSKLGSSAPEGMVPLNDKVAKVFYPTDQGMVQTGQYYADPNVARVLNNAISSGLEKSPTYQAIKGLNNSVNQLQLGVSAFHLTGTAINAGITDVANGLKSIGQGRIGPGAAQVGRGLVPGASFVGDLLKGNKLLSGLKSDSPEAYQFLQEKLNPAGGRLGQDATYSNQAYKTMVTAFKDKNIVGGLAKLPSAAIEQTAKPLMEYGIPRVKLGAFMDAATNAIGSLGPDATPALKQRALADAWDSIDNRFGQLVYDNLGWNKVVKDLAQVMTRSVGWNLGTVREIGGGITDLATKTLRGKGVSDRTLYTAVLPLYVGTIGAVYQYLHTGQWPSQLLDYFYPKNGLTDSSGNPARTTLPTYMKDVAAYSKAPLQTLEHKASPLLSLAEELASNRNYYGDMVRNPQDPIAQQLEQTGSHILNSVSPFSIQQYQQQKSEHASPEQQAESFLGFTKAPKSITQSKLEQQVYGALPAQGPRTPEQVAADTQKAQVRTQIKAGDSRGVEGLIQDGIISPKGAKTFLQNAQEPAVQRAFNNLPATKREQILKNLSPADQQAALQLVPGAKAADMTDIWAQAYGFDKPAANRSAQGQKLLKNTTIPDAAKQAIAKKLGLDLTQIAAQATAKTSLTVNNSQNQLHITEAKQSNNYPAYVLAAQGQIASLSTYLKTLDPQTDATAYNQTMTKIETLSGQVRKYAAQGGLTKVKGGKAKKGRLVKAKTIKLPQPKALTMKGGTRGTTRPRKLRLRQPKLTRISSGLHRRRAG